MAVVGPLDVVAVGFVENHEHVFRHARKEAIGLGGGEHRSGGVVGVGEVHDTHRLIQPRRQRVQVVGVVLERRLNNRAAGSAHRQREHHEGAFGSQPHVARLDVDVAEELNELGRAGAEHNLVHLHPEARRQFLAQIEAARIRVAVRLRQAARHRFDGLRRRAQGVLVRSQLDGGDAELPLHLLDGLAGDVKRQAGHARGHQPGKLFRCHCLRSRTPAAQPARRCRRRAAGAAS